MAADILRFRVEVDVASLPPEQVHELRGDLFNAVVQVLAAHDIAWWSERHLHTDVVNATDRFVATLRACLNTPPVR